MEEIVDGYAMSNRIIRSLDDILKRDSELRDFTIVSTESNVTNKSPILYEHHHLGLESWCIKSVNHYVCDILFSKRKQLAENKLLYSEMENLNCFLNGALLINPDVSTFWNMKRELVNSETASIEGELHFSKIVLTHKSKSNEAFAYRRWLIKKIIMKYAANKSQVPTNLLQDELMVINMASEKSQNNYHSWNHRIWCIEHIANLYPNFDNIIFFELNYTKDWISKHVSEHSGYHYRQYLIKLLKESTKITIVHAIYYNFVINKLELFKQDKYFNILTYLLGKHKKRFLEENCSYINYICILLFDLVILFNDVFYNYFEHQSLYYHRRFIIHHLLRVPFEYHDIQYPKPNVILRNINLWDENIVVSDNAINVSGNIFPKSFSNTSKCQYQLIEIVKNEEKNFISNRTDYLTCEYKKWLKNVIGFD